MERALLPAAFDLALVFLCALAKSQSVTDLRSFPDDFFRRRAPKWVGCDRHYVAEPVIWKVCGPHDTAFLPRDFVMNDVSNFELHE